METEKIPREMLIEHALFIAEEHATYEHTPSTGPRRRHPEYEVDWDFRDVDDWDVDIEDDHTIVLSGMTEGTYSVQVARARYNPPGKAHPAEYETRTVDIDVVITIDARNPPDGIWDATIEAYTV